MAELPIYVFKKDSILANWDKKKKYKVPIT